MPNLEEYAVIDSPQLSVRQKEVIREWREGKRDWRKIAEFIQLWGKGKTGLRSSPKGISVWQNSFAKQLGIHPNNLWRYRKSAEKATEIWGFGKYKVKGPLDIPAHVSPESIELLEKISRAAPTEIVSDLANRLYLDQVKRSELRKIWENIRHVIEKEDVKSPRYSSLPPADHQRRSELFEEVVFEALHKAVKEGGSVSIGNDVRLFMNTRMHIGNKLVSQDIIAIAQDDEGNARYHCFEVKEQLNPKSMGMFQQIEPYFDYSWLVVPSNEIDPNVLPDPIGILHYSAGMLVFIRNAKNNPDANLVPLLRQVIPHILT